MWLLTRQSGDVDSESQLVVYCAHDATYAEQVIQLFEQQTGITVEVRFDEEANKSLGLTNLLIAEQNNPRCDVFWNNQTLGTIRLQHAEILQPYRSQNADRIPNQYKDEAGYWTGFAGRLRVYLVNTDHLSATEDVVNKVLQQGSLSRVAIAQPLFGTTLSHYSVLMAAWGEDRLKAWHAEIHERGIRKSVVIRLQHCPRHRKPRSLDCEEVETLRQWVQQGAKWSQQWAFVKPVRHEPPSTKEHMVVQLDRPVSAGKNGN